MKRLLILALPMCLALSTQAQDINSHYIDAEYRMPEKLSRWDFMPPVESGEDKEADKVLMEAPPYTSTLNATRPIKIENGLQYGDDNTGNKEQKPMMPWQKQHPLLWSKPKS